MNNPSLTQTTKSSLGHFAVSAASLRHSPDIIAAAESRRRRHQALLLGLGSEGLPVMLDLADPTPGPLLILADAGAGKTHLLRFIAGQISYNHHPDEVQFCTLTSYPEQWPAYDQLEHCRGILDCSQASAANRFAAVIGQVRAMPVRAALLLLIDDPCVLHPQALDLLHWLLQSGPSTRIWPVVALNAGQALDVSEWVSRFRTRIFGRIADPAPAEEFTPAPDAGLENLQPSPAGEQFSMRSNGHWLRFWVPFS